MAVKNERIQQAVEKCFDAVKEVSAWLTDHPEVSGEEKESSVHIMRFLESQGYTVTGPYAGMPYSFLAVETDKLEWDGPKAAFMCEYDALPEVGHACGHSYSCGISLLGALALRAAYPDLPVRIDLIGTPGEEFWGGKCVMADNGGFDGYEYAAMIHLCNEDRAEFEVKASNDRYFTFKGKAAHAADAPEQGLNALNAARLFMDAMDMWRQHMEKDWMFHGIVDYGGAAPNIVPEEVRLDYFYRANTLDGLYRLNAISETCAEGAALATGTKVSWEQRYPDYGEIYTPKAAHALAAEIMEEVGRPSAPLKGPGGSSDVGNVSLHIPVFHPMLDVTGYHKEVTMHDRAFEACLHTEKADKVLRDGAYVMAQLAVRLAEDSALMDKIRNDHAAYRGLSVG